MSEAIVEAASVELAATGPAANVAAARDTAQALKTVLDAKDLTVRIGGRTHITAEAWQAMAAISGLTTVIEWTRPIGDGDSAGWEARCAVYTADGRQVGSGESMCTRRERTWSRRDDFALRGMAQTRASSRALRSLLGFVGVLAAGVDSTALAEETDAQAGDPVAASEPAQLPAWARPTDVPPTARALLAILSAAGMSEPAELAKGIGERAFRRCDMTIPACVLAVLEDVAGTIAAAATLGEAAPEGMP